MEGPREFRVVKDVGSHAIGGARQSLTWSLSDRDAPAPATPQQWPIDQRNAANLTTKTNRPQWTKVPTVIVRHSSAGTHRRMTRLSCATAVLARADRRRANADAQGVHPLD